MQRVGILGGTFNPVHSEHISIAKNAIKKLKLDKLLVIPTFMPPHKNTIPAPAEHRIKMLKIAFAGVEKVEINTFEIEKQGKSWSYQTVEHFKADDNELFFICGGDMLTDFKTWRYPERILACCTLAVFDREGYFTDYKSEEEYFSKVFGKQFIKLSYVGKKLSSTRIRINSALELETQDLVPRGVKEYIRENGLYCPQEYTTFLINNLPEKRLKHTANVAVLAMQKVKELNLDAEKVLISSLLHDLAKYLNPEDFKDFEVPKNMPKPVVHAYLGAFVAERVLGIKDEEILSAIRYHTAGRANMSALEKLVFVADMIEEDRNYQGVDELRTLYKEDFEKCFIECLKEEFLHLKSKGQEIFIETINAYNYHVKGE